ncbi:hypothetical protein IG631_08836 [Alternaria alternata]|nr:hypothetical protein IG631_08836 [Alternaria alternata]
MVVRWKSAHVPGVWLAQLLSCCRAAARSPICAFLGTKGGSKVRGRVATVRNASGHEERLITSQERSCACQFPQHDDVQRRSSRRGRAMTTWAEAGALFSVARALAPSDRFHATWGY